MFLLKRYYYAIKRTKNAIKKASVLQRRLIKYLIKALLLYNRYISELAIAGHLCKIYT